MDERYSSKLAEVQLQHTSKKRRYSGQLDDEAACVILSAFFDAGGPENLQRPAQAAAKAEAAAATKEIAATSAGKKECGFEGTEKDVIAAAAGALSMVRLWSGEVVDPVDDLLAEAEAAELRADAAAALAASLDEDYRGIAGGIAGGEAEEEEGCGGARRALGVKFEAGEHLDLEGDIARLVAELAD